MYRSAATVAAETTEGRNRIGPSRDIGLTLTAVKILCEAIVARYLCTTAIGSSFCTAPDCGSVRYRPMPASQRRRCPYHLKHSTKYEFTIWLYRRRQIWRHILARCASLHEGRHYLYPGRGFAPIPLTAIGQCRTITA